MHELDEITGAIVDSAIGIHRSFGPGLLESVYEAALARSLSNRKRRGHFIGRAVDHGHVARAFVTDVKNVIVSRRERSTG